MTNEAKKLEYNKYRYASVAANFLREKNTEYAHAALRVLAKEAKLSDSAEGFVDGALATEKGVQTAVGIYLEKFSKDFYQEDISNLAGYYESALKDVDEVTKKRILKILGKYKGNTVEGILTKISQAQEIAQSQTGNFTDAQRKQAQKTLQKYEDIQTVYQQLERYQSESMRPKVVAQAKKGLESILSKFDEEQAEAA